METLQHVQELKNENRLDQLLPELSPAFKHSINLTLNDGKYVRVRDFANKFTIN